VTGGCDGRRNATSKCRDGLDFEQPRKQYARIDPPRPVVCNLRQIGHIEEGARGIEHRIRAPEGGRIHAEDQHGSHPYGRPPLAQVGWRPTEPFDAT
jgi:hypothetical protein